MSKMARIRITLFILNILNILDILLPNASRTTKDPNASRTTKNGIS